LKKKKHKKTFLQLRCTRCQTDHGQYISVTNWPTRLPVTSLDTSRLTRFDARETCSSMADYTEPWATENAGVENAEAANIQGRKGGGRCFPFRCVV